MSQHCAMPQYIVSACSRMFVFLSDHLRNVFKDMKLWPLLLG